MNSNIENVLAIIDAFDRAAHEAELFGEAIVEAWGAAAEVAYLKAHARLPGGTSSLRLKKKRRDMVRRWFEHEIREEIGRK